MSDAEIEEEVVLVENISNSSIQEELENEKDDHDQQIFNPLHLSFIPCIQDQKFVKEIFQSESIDRDNLVQEEFDHEMVEYFFQDNEVEAHDYVFPDPPVYNVYENVQAPVFYKEQVSFQQTFVDESYKEIIVQEGYQQVFHDISFKKSSFI